MQYKVRLISRGFGPEMGGIGKYAGDVADILGHSPFFDVEIYPLNCDGRRYILFPSSLKIPKDDRINIGFNVFEGSHPNTDITIIHDLIPSTKFYYRNVPITKYPSRFLVSYSFRKAIKKIINSKKGLIFDSELTSFYLITFYIKYKRMDYIKEFTRGFKTFMNSFKFTELYRIASFPVVHPFVYKKVPKYRIPEIKTVGMIGRADGYKNYDLFERIVNINRLKGIVVGPKHKPRKVGNVRYLGFVDDLEKDFWSQIDALVFTSSIEGFGLPILEAFSRRIPVYINKKARIDSMIKQYCMDITEIGEINDALIRAAWRFAKRHTKTTLINGFIEAIKTFQFFKNQEVVE